MCLVMFKVTKNGTTLCTPVRLKQSERAKVESWKDMEKREEKDMEKREEEDK